MLPHSGGFPGRRGSRMNNVYRRLPKSCFLLWPILYTGNQDRLENHGNQPNLGGGGGIRTLGTVYPYNGFRVL
jgi:hypothetical protein